MPTIHSLIEPIQDKTIHIFVKNRMFMSTLCPITIGLDQDQNFQELKKRYRDRKYSDYELLMLLQTYREQNDLDIDFYPGNDEEYRDFTNYLDNPPRKNQRSKVTKESLNELYKAITTLYTPERLNNRLNLISTIFSDYVTELVNRSSMGVSRQQVINSKGTRSQNGFNVILDKVFKYIQKLSTIDGQIEWYKKTYPQASDTNLEQDRKWLEYRASEFEKIFANKGALATLASIRIGEREGFAINIDGFDYKFESIEQIDDIQESDDIDNDIDSEEAIRGDRYVDYRTLPLSSTLSVEAREMLRKLYLRDENGNVVQDDLGYAVPVDTKQAIVALHKVLQNSTAETMMDDLSRAIPRYSWIKSLVQHLEKNPDDRTLAFTDFKKSRSNYFYGYKDKSGQIAITQSNKVANGKSLSKEAGITLRSGANSTNEYSLVDDHGNIVNNDALTNIKKEIDSISTFSKNSLPVKPVSSVGAYKSWTTADAAGDWRTMVNEKPESDFQNLTDVLRGFGFSLSASEVKNALAESAPIASITGTRKDAKGEVTPQVSSLDRIVSALREIVNRAEYINKKGEDLTGTHLYNYSQDQFAAITNILSAIQRGDVEERSISGKKSLGSYNTPNAIHDLVDKLSNAASLSDDDYKQMLMHDFGRYEGMSLGFGKDLKLTGLLKDLYDDGRDGSDASFKTMRRSFRVVDMTDFNGKDFARMTSVEHAIASYSMYMRGTDNRTNDMSGHMYELPIQADYENAYNFIVAPSYSKEELIERFAQEVECEAQRIVAIQERQSNDPQDSAEDPIRAVPKVYENRGVYFQIFPNINNNGFVEEYSSATPVGAHEIAKQYVRRELENLLIEEKNKYRSYGLFKKKNLKLAGIKSENDSSVDDWLLNGAYIRQQMTKLMYGGIEHFKSTPDFEKRNLYSHATRIPLYTKATFNGQQVGKENQRALYLADDETRSAFYERICAIADKLQKEGKITAAQNKQLKEAYKSITTTDGQGFRTLDSYREVKIMAKLWTDSDEVAYQHIKSGNFGPNDVKHFMVGIKPIYTGYEILEAQPGEYQKPIRVPVLHKYSEMVLLPEMLEASGVQNASAPLKALNKINDNLSKDNKIDLFIFVSGVKVGAHSVIDAFAKTNSDERILKDSESIADFVTEKINSGNFWVHTLPYKYYGISSSMHADVTDKMIAWASQAMKEAWGNIMPGEHISINGKQVLATDARDLFYKILAARTIDTYKKISERLADRNEIAKIMKTELANKSYQPRDLIFALQMRDNGKFAYPLYSPNIQHEATALLASMVRKSFTKVPTKGANMTQTTSLGLDTELEQTAFTDNLPAGFTPLEVKFDDNGNFLYVDAYLPIYDSRFEQFADENGNITPERLNQLVKEGFIPESILNFIGYRTPSDAEHSVIPCRVKGFISNVAGPSIRLPREIMKMTGHDYDGDKMRCHFKEFATGWNYDKIKKDFDSFSKVEAVQSLFSTDDPTLTPYEVFKRNATNDNPENDKYRALKPIDFDYRKSIFDNIGKDGSYDALNNALVDLMFAQLTSENGGLKMFIPGGCEETKEYANSIGSRKRKKSVTTPFAVSHSTESHDYMMEGAGMIGIYALYNSAGAMFQRMNLSYIPRTDKDGNNIPVRLFGKDIDRLFPIITNNSFTTLGQSRLLNAAVDNGKEPLLGYLNQTAELSPLTNFLFAAGLEEKYIHLLMNQPVMIELASRMKGSSRKLSEEAESIIGEIQVSLSKGVQENVEQFYQQDSVSKMYDRSAKSFTQYLGKSYQEMIDSADQGLRDQVIVLQTMQHLNPAASDLEEFTKLTRPESDAGGIDSSIGGIISKLIQLDNFRERLSAESDNPVHIAGMDKVLEYRDIQENSMTPQMLLDSFGNELPEVVALNSLMKDRILTMFRDYFPQAKDSWMRISKRIAKQYSYSRLPSTVIDRIGTDMILFKLLSNNAIVTGDPQQEQERIVKQVPENLRTLKKRINAAKENPGVDPIADKLVGNIFLNNLDLGATVGSEGENISRIRFQLNGSALEDTADNIRAAWSELLYLGDAYIKKLATDLFKYNLYTNGFSYGRYEFSHFAPVSVILETPGYIKALNNILNEDWAEDDEDNFYHQYIRNHWGDKNLLHTYDPKELPVAFQEMMGMVPLGTSRANISDLVRSLGNMDYFLVRRSVNGKTEDELYQINKTASGEVLSITREEKLGIRNKNSQVIVQYNPRVRNYHEVKPVFTTNSVAWEGRDGRNDNNEEEEAEARRQAAIDEMEFAIPIPGITADTVKKEEKELEKAEKENSGKLSAEQVAGIPGFDGLEEDTVPTDNRQFYLVHRDGDGNIVSGYYEATPEVVEQARAQQAFLDLNKQLRKILADHGVRVGALEEAEARLMAGGVTDFSSAKVLVEGMAELIRISNGVEGEYALPEEFAHVAIEMLGGHTVDRDELGNITGFHHENALITRLLNALNNSDTALEEAYGGQLDQYREAYGNDREKLIMEAAGKLVAKRLFMNQYIKTPSTRNLVQRVCNAIKAFFKNFSIRRLYDAMFGAEKIASQLAKDLLSGQLADDLSLDKITTNDQFYKLDNDISGKQDILSKMQKTVLHQIDVIERRMKYTMKAGATSASLNEAQKQLAKLRSTSQKQKLEITIADYLKDTMIFMSDMEKSLDAAINNRPANTVCRKMRIVKDTLFGYAAVVKDINAAIQSGELQDDVELEEAIAKVSRQVEKFWAKYDSISMRYFKEFLRNVYGADGVTVTTGKNKGKVYTIDDMATHSDHDIRFHSRFLDAVSDSDDFVLVAIDDVTRNAKYNARERLKALRPKLEAAMTGLIKEQGSRDQSFMFEYKTDKDGNKRRTGRYISKEEAKNLTSAQKEFYDVFMEMKQEADACLPTPLVSLRRMIMFRKKHYEKMREAQGGKEKLDEVWENSKRGWLEMGDIDYENEKVIKDFEDNIVDQLPIKFLNKGKNESYDDMTEDVASSLMAYCGMAFEYQEMNNVIGILENAKYMSSKRDIEQKRGLKDMIIDIGKEKGPHYKEPYTVKQAKTMIQGAMNDYFKMHVYGHLQKDEGTIGKTRISKRKVVNKLAGYTSLAQMALNLHQRIANINTGMTQVVVEVAGGELKMRDVMRASAIWMKESMNRLAETGKTDYANKLSLWMDHFDIHQDNGREEKGINYTKSNASRIFNSHLLYAGLSIGEDFLAGTTALAFANNVKLIGPNGEKSNLWDAYEVKYIHGSKEGKDGSGAYLQMKPGYKKEDGTDFTKEDERAFMKKVISANFALQGIYNEDDRSAIQQHSLGALALMYRKWIAPAMKRRYGSARYSKLQDQYTEGYYRTFIRLAGDTIKDWFAPASEEDSKETVLRILTDMKAMTNSIRLNWGKLDAYEKGNVKKALLELSVVAGLFITTALLGELPPDDKDDNKFVAWAEDIAITQLFRLRAEIGSQAPTPNLVKEFGRILSSPFAALRPMVDTLNVFQLLLPSNYIEEVQSGRYKGHSKAHKYFMKLPVVSLFRKFDNFIDPSDVLNYYKNQNY